MHKDIKNQTPESRVSDFSVPEGNPVILESM